MLFLSVCTFAVPFSTGRNVQVIIQGSLGLRQGDGACLLAIATLDGKDVGKTAVGCDYAETGVFASVVGQKWT